MLCPRVQCCVAGTLIALKKLPPKLNPIIRPIMDGIKKEENSILQVTSVYFHILINFLTFFSHCIHSTISVSKLLFCVLKLLFCILRLLFCILGQGKTVHQFKEER